MKDLNHLKHFYNRFGFGLSFSDFQTGTDDFNPSELLAESLRKNRFKKIESTSTLPTPAELKTLSKEKRKELSKADKQAFIQLNNDWIAQMAQTENIISEKMSLFWHDHFACKAKTTDMAANQINFIRKNALGNFRTLIHGIAKDPAMLLYVNNQQNRKNKPNENFARELMELFTLGIGNYTEEDIAESARAFTGWRMDGAGKFELNAKTHDTDSKAIFGQIGNWEGEDVIDMILEKEACAQFISKKIARYFIGPTIEEIDLKTFANVLFEKNYEIAPLLQAIADASSFNNPNNFANDILSPIELLVKMERSFGLNFHKNSGRIYVQRTLGQFLLQPPNVSGWPTGKEWIDTSTLTLRLRLSRAFLLQQDTGKKAKASFAQGEDLAENLSRQASKRLGAEPNLQEIKNAWSALSYQQKVDEAANWLLPNGGDKGLREAIAKLGVAEDKQTETALALVAGIPEFQLK